MNEYNIVGPEGSQSVLYHCPWCGGVAPASKRPNYFAVVTDGELHRLQELTRGLSSLQEAVKRFGPPAEDREHGVTTTTPGSGSEPPVTTSHRTLKFGNLSDTVDVVIEDHGVRGVRTAFAPPYLGGREGGEV
jgi:hypothetical protein